MPALTKVLSDWERRLLLAVLCPILWLQARRVRRNTPHLPEAHGSRCGTTGTGPLCRVLLAGDSGAAGVGVARQADGLCGQLVQRLSQNHTVQWCLLASNGLDSPGLLKLLEDTPPRQFDVVVISMGANDATQLCSPRRWIEWQEELAELIEERFSPTQLIHCAVPPMHACLALPHPLRWFMGRWALEMNRLLAAD